MSNVLAVDHQLAPHNGDRASSDPGQEVSGSAGNRLTAPARLSPRRLNLSRHSSVR